MRYSGDVETPYFTALSVRRSFLSLRPTDDDKRLSGLTLPYDNSLIYCSQSLITIRGTTR